MFRHKLASLFYLRLRHFLEGFQHNVLCVWWPFCNDGIQSFSFLPLFCITSWSSVVTVQMLLILNIHVTTRLASHLRRSCLAGGCCDIYLSFNVWRSGGCIISGDNQQESQPKSICVPIDLQVTVFRLGRNSNKLLSPFDNPHSQTFC
jgi:hypothetical protein